MSLADLVNLFLQMHYSEYWELELSGPNRFPTARHKIFPFWSLALGCLCPHPILHMGGLYNFLPHWWGLN